MMDWCPLSGGESYVPELCLCSKADKKKKNCVCLVSHGSNFPWVTVVDPVSCPASWVTLTCSPQHYTRQLATGSFSDSVSPSYQHHYTISPSCQHHCTIIISYHHVNTPSCQHTITPINHRTNNYIPLKQMMMSHPLRHEDVSEIRTYYLSLSPRARSL